MKVRDLNISSTPVAKGFKKLRAVWKSDPNEGQDCSAYFDKPAVLEKKMTEKRVGYWRGVPRANFHENGTVVDYPDCPDVKNFVDPSWDKNEHQRVIEYLNRGREKHAWMGWSTCRICGCRNGTSCKTDGKWVWPEGLAHYLEAHWVKPPQAFLDYVKKRLA